MAIRSWHASPDSLSTPGPALRVPDSSDRRDDRSAHRPAQPPRLPAGCREPLLQQQIARDRPIGVLPIDLDHFNPSTTGSGHRSATRSADLRRIAQANLREADLVGRLGGEEFVVVLAEASIENAYLAADRLRNVFAVGASVSTTRRCTRPSASASSVISRSGAGTPQARSTLADEGALSRQGARRQPRRGRAAGGQPGNEARRNARSRTRRSSRRRSHAGHPDAFLVPRLRDDSYRPRMTRVSDLRTLRR